MKETWKDVAGFEGYKVSNSGKILGSMGTILKPKISRWGYHEVSLSRHNKKTMAKVHLLVLCAFNGERPDGLVGMHKNGNKFDNSIANLRWGTQKENEADKRRHGIGQFGTSNASSKLSEKDIAYIKANFIKLKNRASNALALATKFGVSEGTIQNLIYGKTYKYLNAKEAMEAA